MKWREAQQIPLSRETDRRVTLTDTEREEIRNIYPKFSQRELAKQYQVSRRLIQFILSPERYEKAREQFRNRRMDGRYKESKEKRAKDMRDHRRYKAKLFGVATRNKSAP